MKTDLSRGWRTHAAVLAFGTFAVGTDGFVVAGILPEIARSLDVSVAAAGQLVTVFSIAYAVLAPVLATLTAGWSRRVVLPAGLALFAVGNVITALAPSYALVLVSRAVAAGGASLYAATASATAAAIAGDERRGRAIAIVMLGLTSSLALGAPLGTAVGAALGWRATMWLVTALALVVVPIIAVRLPDVGGGPAGGWRQRLAPLADRRVLGVLATTVVAFTGIYVPYTYLSAVYEPATGGQGSRVAVLLLVFGVAGTVGNLLAGHFTDRTGPRRVVITGTLLLTLVFLLVPALRGSYATAVAAIAVGGVFSFTVTTPQQHLIMSYAPPGTQPMAASLNQSALYLAVSLSGAAGGLALDAGGATLLPPLAAVFVAAAAVLTWLFGRADARRHDRADARRDGRVTSEPRG
ncbi:MFS transporter [[Actinomadura] parvosata subsp. kistnae]|uniref:MFS transporter n=1 Tax=[Actinomadura] parvosata subsp. kistnae TaxID=1909395 RepID=A0A1U9ZU35_9ACTN|nr:MFS transporter [Nonomuraea sp. ATCC 55076]AQZ61447.1 MFS transporter [Nonomuraea sp. ATCC 55076]